MLNKLVISKQLVLLQENESWIMIYNSLLCKTSAKFKPQAKQETQQKKSNSFQMSLKFLGSLLQSNQAKHTE